jgi:hypothetical protein
MALHNLLVGEKEQVGPLDALRITSVAIWDYESLEIYNGYWQ